MADFNPAVETNKYSYVTHRFTVPVGLQQILTANNNRVGIVIANNQIYSFALTQAGSGSPDVTPSLMVNGGESRVFSWDEYGGLLTLRWFGGQTTTFNSNVTAPGGVVLITEIIYIP